MTDSNGSADALDNNPFLTSRNVDDLKEAVRSNTRAAHLQIESNAKFTRSIDRLADVTERLATATEKLDATLREVTTVTVEPTAPVASTAIIAAVEPSLVEISGVPVAGVVERRRKSRQTG